MPTYVGVNNVVRNVPNYRVGVNSAVRTVSMAYAGVSGVARSILGKFTDNIARIEVWVSRFEVHTTASTPDANGNYNWSYEGSYTTRSSLPSGSTISISSQYINVTCRTISKVVEVLAIPVIIMKNGESHNFAAIGNLPFSWPIRYDLSFSGSGGIGTYELSALNVTLLSGYINNGANGTTTVTNTSSGVGMYADGEIAAGRINSGTTVSQQTYTNITIDGVTFPVTVVDRLTA